ncbi:MAG: hypothetical protein P9L94_17315 [Candidatus Hinthialibacter antarcticus]|nr:hypothetical protein [Candidatus Hinthialibacter antarcticus]
MKDVQPKDDIQAKRRQRRCSTAGFSMVEIIVVIGIIGVMTGIGAVTYMGQINSSRVSSMTAVINTNLVQARQMAIAMRQSRRVVIDPGKIEDASGQRIKPARIWIEGKICEEFNFDEEAYCSKDGGPNTFIITDPDLMPDGVSLVDVGTDLISEFNDDDESQPLYIQFNPRGQLSKIYFLGGEQSARPKDRQAILHMAKDSAIFKKGDETRSYDDLVSQNLNTFAKDEENANERYKINTIEILWLTGKTRVYDYAVFGFWPNDLLDEES